MSFSDSSSSSGSLGSRVARIAGVDESTLAVEPRSSAAVDFDTVSVDVDVAPAVTTTSPPVLTTLSVVDSTLGSVLASPGPTVLVASGLADVARDGVCVVDDVSSVFGEPARCEITPDASADVVTCWRVVSGVEWLSPASADDVADGL